MRDAGIACDVLVAPILPGISDSPEQLAAVARACAEAGARSVTPIVLHLRPGVREEYMGWLTEARPDLLEEYERRYGKGAYLPTLENRRIRCASTSLPPSSAQPEARWVGLAVQQVDVRQVAVALPVVEAVADHELVR